MATALLVSPAFAPLAMPSIGLSLLVARSKADGHDVSILYAGNSLANEIGVEFYNSISNGYPSTTALAGEFLFSSSTFGEFSQFGFERFVETHLVRPPKTLHWDSRFHEEFLSSYRRAVQAIPQWVTMTADQIVAAAPQIVGFSSMFQQTIPALALATDVKQRDPSIVTVFGGPNFEDPMGSALMDAFECIDYVCSGEGEEAFAGLLRCIDRASDDLHPNLRSRSAPKETSLPQRLIEDLSALQTPDYNDYFEQLECLDERESIHPSVLLETSRGCWWGMKAHCTFCGLNGKSMTFRSKRPEAVLDEIRGLQAKFPDNPISVVDNILDHDYFNNLIPWLAEADDKVDLFFETKANLTREQVRLMRLAGICRIQPGVESLSAEVLRLMRKGVTPAQNIALLRMCMEEQVRPEWNFLWGFPGEDPEDYAQMAVLAESLVHLPAPNAAARLRLDRYSPLFIQGESMGLANIRPYDAYFELFAESDVDVSKVAYYFEFDYIDGRNPASYTSRLLEVCRSWAKHSSSTYLFYLPMSECTVVADGRVVDEPRFDRLASSADEVFKFCDRRRSVSQVFRFVEKNDLRSVLDLMISRGYVVIVDGFCVSLASNLFSFPEGSPKVSAFLKNMASADSQEQDDFVVVPLCEV